MTRDIILSTDIISSFEPQSSPFATHVPILRAVGKGIKTVLELGAGEFSTPLFLDKTYYPDLVQLVTIEQNTEWVRSSEDDRHRIVIVPEPIEPFLGFLDLDSFDLIFVDNSMVRERRCETIKYVASHVMHSLVIAHDYEYPHYRESAKEFDNAIVDDRQCPWTAILWK